MSTQTSQPVDALDPRLNRTGAMGTVKQRWQNGQLGSIPVFFGLLILFGFFWWKGGSAFIGAFNMVSLTQEIAAFWGFIALGLTLVLLLGEIDLSAASVSGLAAAVVAVLAINHHYVMWQAIVAGVLTGTLVGLLQGTIITKLGLPSFVVTLAGLLGWQGFMIWILGSTGNINLANTSLQKFCNSYLPHWLSYVLAIGIPLIAMVLQLIKWSRKQAAGLSATQGQLGFIIGSNVVLLLALGGGAFYLNKDRGVGKIFALLLVAFLIVHIVLLKTRPGRNIYAVGGNAEAARRAGIDVTRVKLMVFIVASTLAAFGGIISAGYQQSVSQSSGGGDVLINSIAACVIGGVSLFGGRGNVWMTLIGLFVIGLIADGLPFLNISDASVQYMITGAVLLAAVVLDGIARRGQVKR